MRRNTPTRVIETGRLARGASGQPTGWLQNLAERARNLRAQLQGVSERIHTPLMNGVPDCVNGEVTFRADTATTVTITNFPEDQNITTGGLVSPLTVNPIILAGKTYRIPITFTPPGIMQAHNLVVGIEAGLEMFNNRNVPYIVPLCDYPQTTPPYDPSKATPLGGWIPGNADDNFYKYTWKQQVLGTWQSSAYLPYVWNIIDEKSGRQYAQDWIPSGALLNSRGLMSSSQFENVDSELFEFDTPWLFERDAQVAFLFRPIMDLYQVAASDAEAPYKSIVDNSNIADETGERRNSIATVRVEFHGNRYYTSQDVLKDGAMVTNAYDESQQNRPQRRRP